MRLPNSKLFWAVSLGHAANDLFMGMRNVVLVYISRYLLPMSSREVGLAAGLIELTGAVSQPLMGWIADKTGGRWLGSGGVAWTVSLMLTGFIIVSLGGSFWMMIVPMMLAALGSAAFHPVGSMYAADVEPTRAARNSALFFMFGQIGLAIGPILAGVLLNNTHSRLNEWFGAAIGPTYPPLVEYGTLSPLFMLAALAVPGVVLMAITLPARSSHRLAMRQSDAAKATLPPIPRLPLLILAIAVALRAMGHLSTVTFMSYIFQLKGWSPAAYGFITGSFWIASGIAGVIFGHFGDRYDSRWVIMFSLIASAPAIFLLPSLDGGLAIIAAMTIGGLSGSHSLIVVMAQGMMKGRKGLASGAILGFIFASGAISTQIMGDLIERVGPITTYHIAAGLTVVASLVWLLLPKPQRTAPQPVVMPETATSAAD